MENSNVNIDLIRGHMDTIILRTLADGDKYGLEMLSEIKDLSKEMYSLKQPTLYNSLKRLEKSGYITSYPGDMSNGAKRVYYSLTDLGREYLQEDQLQWEFSRTIIDSLLSDKIFDPAAIKPFEPSDFRPLTKRAPRASGEQAREPEVIVKEVPAEPIIITKEIPAEPIVITKYVTVEVEKKADSAPSAEEDAKTFFKPEPSADFELIYESEKPAALIIDEKPVKDKTELSTSEVLTFDQSDRVYSVINNNDNNDKQSTSDITPVKVSDNFESVEKQEEYAEPAKSDVTEKTACIDEPATIIQYQQENKSDSSPRAFAEAPIQYDENEYYTPECVIVNHTYEDDIFDNAYSVCDCSAGNEQDIDKNGNNESNISQPDSENEYYTPYLRRDYYDYSDDYEEEKAEKANKYYRTAYEEIMADTAPNEPVAKPAKSVKEPNEPKINYIDSFSDIYNNEELTLSAAQEEQIITKYEEQKDEIFEEVTYAKLKDQLIADNIKLKQYTKSKTSSYYVGRYYYSNRLLRDWSYILYVMFAIFTLISHFSAGAYTTVKTSALLATLAIGLLLPALTTALWYFDPSKRKRTNFSIGYSMITGLIVILSALMAILLVSFFGYHIDVRDYSSMVIPLVIPCISIILVPISILIFALLYNSRRYHVK